MICIPYTPLDYCCVQVVVASRGTGLFVTMMKGAVGLAIGTDGIEVTLLSYLVPCVAAEWDLTPVLQGTLTASVFAGELVSARRVVGTAFGQQCPTRTAEPLNQ